MVSMMSKELLERAILMPGNLGRGIPFCFSAESVNVRTDKGEGIFAQYLFIAK